MIFHYILFFYRSLWSVKHQILISVFGVSSHCKHTPTCSRYLEEQIKNRGTITGLWEGMKRLLTCW